MRKLQVEICNERLLPRFGVDRLLLLLAERLLAHGHVVRLTCLRYDESLLKPALAEAITAFNLPPGLDMQGTEAAVTGRLLSKWQDEGAPDVMIIGGWPFFEAAARARGAGVGSIFIDAGAVAQDGMPEALLPVQLELRRIRQITLPAIGRLLPISDFIRRSQSEPDRGSAEGVRTVLLGGDHLAAVEESEIPIAGRELLAGLDARLERGEQLLLSLGRFEANTYKNSTRAYEMLRRVRAEIPTARLLLLDAGQDCGIPPELSDAVICLGAPDDATLVEVMRRCAAGVSTSFWEGFNLPIAEMQWLGRPALAFPCGAHPEVIAEPWLLCETVEEMARKIARLLRGDQPLDLEAKFAAGRRRLTWDATLSAWEDEIAAVAASKPALEAGRAAADECRVVLVDVSNASLDPANPGVIRVVRRLCAELQRSLLVEPVYVAWDRNDGQYCFLDATRRRFLSGYSGPKDGLGALAANGNGMSAERFLTCVGSGRSRPPVLFLPEVLCDDQAAARMRWGRERGCKLATIVYDLIPVYYPELCDPAITAAFPAYLGAVSGVDAIWTISDFTMDCLRRFYAEAGHTMPALHRTVWLPGQLSEQRSGMDSAPDTVRETRMLVVSTLEPRKGHLRLIEAFRRLRASRPHLPLRLVLIGNRYAGAPEIAAGVEEAARRDRCIEWLGPVDDTRLKLEFQRAAFTVYASLVEGFGLPILESLWMGRPCLTHNCGVMAELAKGGCVTVDMNDPAEIARAMERLATDGELLGQLRAEACDRRIPTWQDYAVEMGALLAAL